jgi:2-polyprenyl-3-methyl-5-hydroxy-6-metoxy-1,4-benzoquinol methylase
MGRGLKEANAALTVWGVEINPAAAEEAARHLDKVFLIDVEKAEDPFGEARFDCIVIADVLEHLKDPWSLLRKMAGYLAPGGKVICSVPNIGHYKAVKDILRDRWLYREEGLLDIDHLRFFTFSTVKHMCAVSGLSIVRLERNRKASNFMRLLNAVSLGRMEKMLTHQYLLVCERRLAP